MNNMANIFGEDALTKINAVSTVSEDARVGVMDTFIGLGKKFDAMDLYGLPVASNDETMQHFIENRDTICEQFYQESVKGRNKFMTSVFYGSLGGTTLGSLLVAAPAVALLQFGFIGGIAGGALLGAGAVLGGFGGTVIGVKISDKSRSDKARKEVLGDINDLISEIIKANSIDDGSDDIVFSKGVSRALDILFESTNMILRNESSGKLKPVMSKEEKEACISLTTALTNFATKKDAKSAKILFKVLNTVVEEILESLGADVTEAEKEIREKLKKSGDSKNITESFYQESLGGRAKQTARFLISQELFTMAGAAGIGFVLGLTGLPLFSLWSIGISASALQGTYFARRYAALKRGKDFKSEYANDITKAIQCVGKIEVPENGVLKLDSAADKALNEVIKDNKYIADHSTKIEGFTDSDFSGARKLEKTIHALQSSVTKETAAAFLKTAAELLQSLSGMTDEEKKKDAELFESLGQKAKK